MGEELASPLQEFIDSVLSPGLIFGLMFVRNVKVTKCEKVLQVRESHRSRRHFGQLLWTSRV